VIGIVRSTQLTRKVAHDALVDVDTVRYSVPHRLVRERVEVQVGQEQVRIFHAGQVVATHARSSEPHGRVIDPAHWEGLWRPRTVQSPGEGSALADLGRTLDVYAEVVEQATKRGAA